MFPASYYSGCRTLVDQEHTDFDAFTAPTSYREPGLIHVVTNVLLLMMHLLLTHTFTGLPLILYKTVFEDVSWQDDTRELYCDYKM